MAVLDNILYSESHEWIKVDGNIAFIGISDFAQESLVISFMSNLQKQMRN